MRSVIPLVHGRIYRFKINLDASDMLPRQKIQGPSNGCPLLAGTFGFGLADFFQIEADYPGSLIHFLDLERFQGSDLLLPGLEVP